MIDLVYHILTNHSATNTAVGGRITADLRVQTQGTPAITIDWLATDDLYRLKDTCKHSVYTVDVYIHSQSMGECATVMGHVLDALDRFKGQVTPATGNTYTVINTTVIDRTIDVLDEADMIEGQITFEITA